MATKKTKALPFEASMDRLEEIVRTMERGESTLEESLKLFEEGTSLVNRCINLLDEAQLRVTMVTPGPDGVPQEEDFHESD